LSESAFSDAERAWLDKAYERYESFLKYVTPALQEIDPARIAWLDPGEYDPEAVRILWSIESGICEPNKKAIRIHLQRIFEDMFWYGQGVHTDVDWTAAAFRILGAWHRFRARLVGEVFPIPCSRCEAARLPADHPAMRGPQGYGGDWLGVTYFPCDVCGRLRVRAVPSSEYPIPEDPPDIATEVDIEKVDLAGHTDPI
jgi:hypothetical protein